MCLKHNPFSYLSVCFLTVVTHKKRKALSDGNTYPFCTIRKNLIGLTTTRIDFDVRKKENCQDL